MTERVTLTERRMRDLQPPTSGDRLVYDEEVCELAVRLRAGGPPRWYLQKWARGRQRRVALGTWPSITVELARELAREHLVKLARGGDPVKEKREAASKARGGRVPLVDALKHHLSRLREKVRSQRHIDELKRVAETAVAAGVKDLADPSVASKAERWLAGLDVSDLTRARYRRHLIAVGRTAMRWWPADTLARDPFFALTGTGAPLPPPPTFTPLEAARLVSDEAIANVENGGPLWAFLLLSGCRYLEGAWAHRSRIDVDRAVFSVIPPTAEEYAAGARVKRGKARDVTLQAELVELLRAWIRDDTTFLFPKPWRTQPHVYNTFAFRAQLDHLDIPLNGRRIHSLRHTHATLGVACGEDGLRLRLSMGHAGEEMQRHYAAAAMRWRGLLHHWHGVFRLRDKAEVERLTKAAPTAQLAS